ncbi:MAG: helix-turn-helix transcriptional regulator [Candidatus Sedimenticola sp. (ex Thyasira tokunagai)]
MWCAEAEIKTRLRETRKEAGLTQVQLAVRAGTIQAVIQKIENGHSTRYKISILEGLGVLEILCHFSKISKNRNDTCLNNSISIKPWLPCRTVKT